MNWYKETPRGPLRRALVQEYSAYLENLSLASSTINVRLAAIHTDSRGLNVDARFEEDEGDDEASIGQTQSSGGGGGGYFVFQQPSGYIPFQDSIPDTGQTALPIYTVDSKPATDSSQSVASQSAGNIAVGNEQRPGPLTTLFNATNSLLSALSILPNFTIIAPIPTTLGLLGVQADIAYLPKTGQVCPSIGLNFSPGGAYGFTISLLLDPQNVAPNVIPGFSAGFGMQPVIGAGISATGSFGQPLLTGPSIGYRGVGISASWGACWP